MEVEMKALSLTMLFALLTHAHARREDRGLDALGWEEVYSHFETPSAQHPKHYPYVSRHTPYYRSSSSRVPTDSLSRFID